MLPRIQGEEVDARKRRDEAGIVVFHGGKGGVGATTLAAESVALLGEAGLRVAALELDLFHGDLHYRLDIPVSRGTYTLTDLLPVLDEVDGRMLENALSAGRCGARLLPAPASPGEARAVEAHHVVKLFSAIADEFDHVIVDTSSTLDEVTVAALELAGVVALVVSPELASLGGARRLLDLLGSREKSARRVSLVVNRSLGGDDLVSIADIESFLGMPVALVLPEETARCRRLADEGRTIASERSALGQGISAMVGRMFPSSAAP